MLHKKIGYGFLLNMLFIWSGNANISYNNFNVNITEKVIVDSIEHPKNPELKVYFFRPENTYKPLPVIYFCHGIGATNPQTYRFLIDYIVANNVCVCYSTCDPVLAAITPRVAYTHLWKGFVAGHKKWKQFIDNRRIGIVGHSYGGGAAANIAWKAVHQKKWGKNGCFVYIMAPWYCYGMNSNRFNEFPKHTILVTQVFEDDNINDYRMACDIYRSFGIPKDRKCFITVFSAKNGSTKVEADHGVPEVRKTENLLGKYVVFPVIDSLLYYAFDESFNSHPNTQKRRYQLRTTGAEQGWECRFIKDNTCALKQPQSNYINFWGHSMNPRIKGTRAMPRILRLGLHTPQTIIRYCALGLGRMDKDKENAAEKN